MTKRKVLYVCHNHPSVRPGGAEAYALELYEAMRAGGEFTPILLSKGGPPFTRTVPSHPGTLFGAVNEDPNQYFFYADAAAFDWFYGTSNNKEIYTKHFRDFLLAHRPDVVHFQHTTHLGYDLIRQARNTLPNAPIIYTLHEYLPICHRQGQMVRTQTNELCSEASPRRCHECFPERSPQDFFMRSRFIQAHLSLVDIFLAPSEFLLERYVTWGIPRSKIRFEEYGRHRGSSLPESDSTRARNRLGFFGQLNPYKGVDVLLRAMRIVSGGLPKRLSDGSAVPHLWIHGANLDLQVGGFQQEFQELLDSLKPWVTLVGRYGPSELPRLLANIDWVVVPSIWWENSPLVIQEAFMHARPVLCSGIGGMAEKVRHGVNGLHFRAGDSQSLAETIRSAVATPGLWETLRRGIPDVYRMDDHVASLVGLYGALLSRSDLKEVRYVQ